MFLHGEHTKPRIIENMICSLPVSISLFYTLFFTISLLV